MNKRFPSEKYPEIQYAPGEDIWEEWISACGFPFYFDISEELTADEDSVRLAASFLDRLEDVERSVKEQLKESMANGEHEYHELVCDFFQMHRQELDDETLENMLGVKRAEELTDLEMLERLYIKRLGSSIDEEWNQQVFILDFSFNPEYTDELLVVFLSRNAKVLSITHES